MFSPMLAATLAADTLIESRQMGVTRCGLNLCVAKQFADHRQGLAERQRPAGEAVP